MARKHFFVKRRNNRFRKKKVDWDCVKWVVKRLEMKFKDLNRKHAQAKQLRQDILDTLRTWNNCKDVFLLENYKEHEKTIKYLSDAICTNASDLGLLRTFYTAKMKNISENTSIEISSNEWWNMVIHLTQCQDLMDHGLEVFHEAYCELKDLQTKISPCLKNRTNSTIRYFITS